MEFGEKVGAAALKSYMKFKKKKKNVSQTDDRAKSYDISKFPDFYAHFMLV